MSFTKGTFYPLVVGIPEATYPYHVKLLEKADNDQPLKEQIEHFFFEFKERYGYERITEELKILGYRINHEKSLSSHKRNGFKMCRRRKALP